MLVLIFIPLFDTTAAADRKQRKDEYTLNVLRNYDRAITFEEKSSKFLEGKLRGNMKSRFSLSNVFLLGARLFHD